MVTDAACSRPCHAAPPHFNPCVMLPPCRCFKGGEQRAVIIFGSIVTASRFCLHPATPCSLPTFPHLCDGAAPIVVSGCAAKSTLGPMVTIWLPTDSPAASCQSVTLLSSSRAGPQCHHTHIPIACCTLVPRRPTRYLNEGPGCRYMLVDAAGKSSFVVAGDGGGRKFRRTGAGGGPLHFASAVNSVSRCCIAPSPHPYLSGRTQSASAFLPGGQSGSTLPSYGTRSVVLKGCSLPIMDLCLCA